MLATRAACRAAQRAGLSTSASDDVKARLRALLRETAQPVAVVTSLLPSPDKTFHGATLSSFTSIAMDPYPLVAFSLKIPSRMASSLRVAHPQLSSHMVVNILSASQASTAILFSRPDLHPHPFEQVGYYLNDEGIPILEGSLGALSCKLASLPLALDDLALSGRNLDAKSTLETAAEAFTSELFIARVTKVEKLAVDDVEAADSHVMPLLHHRREYVTVHTKNSHLPIPKV
ncbi:hypothetical protein D9757_007465 [Collybiopsis confluens]|uniref:Flavin reductase like domain-containing protein n=1 Tax=Collybiopsis confluens TaxID=2823264 RepID=A0A8H5M8I0_9AGAR|nr:hypothetical protein D9757_007465 [Collybiopsis confluens]